MRSIVVALAAVASAHGALAAPARLSDEGVAAWVSANKLEGERWRYVSWSAAGAFFVLKDGVNGFEDPLMRYLAKVEFFEPRPVLGRRAQSMSLMMETDCKARVSRVYGAYIYERQGLAGGERRESEPDRRWREPAIPSDQELDRVCAATRKLSPAYER